MVSLPHSLADTAKGQWLPHENCRMAVHDIQLPKPKKIRLGNWEVAVLSQEQLNYAATDAYVSWYLYQVLKNLPDPPENKSEEIVVPPNDLISSTSI
ncbi:UNVERIFIED_CONTAM: Werner Syndrome-like exonuclease [Sesamum calycinum]